jgi:hypothetical protein
MTSASLPAATEYAGRGKPASGGRPDASKSAASNVSGAGAALEPPKDEAPK